MASAMRRPGMWLLAATVIVGVTGMARAQSTARLPAHPNVLFIAIDDLRDWVGYLKKNQQTITPNLDRLASRGVYFTHSYCAAPVCNPSRAALMSGLRPFTTGVYENNNDWRRVIGPELTLPTTFRNAGYYVCGAGKIYHEAYRRDSEWNDYLKDEGNNPKPQGNPGVGGIRFCPLDCRDEDMREWNITNYAIAELRKKHDKPLFLACGLHKPHMPWDVPRKYYDMHPLAGIELPPHLDNDLDDIPPAGVRMAKPEGDHRKILESGRWKDAVQGYLAAISFSDAMVGRVLDAFDKSEYRENSIIVLWSDHGWHLGEKQHWRKFALWEEATRSPLIWVVPGLTQGGAACDRPIDFMTIYPTLCDVCNIPIPKHVEGPSIRTLLADPRSPWDKPAITTYKFMNHAVRLEDWRYIRYADGDEELYHNAIDQFEWTNLAAKAEYAPQKAAMSKFVPQKDHPDIGGSGGEEDFGFGTKADRKARKKGGN